MSIKFTSPYGWDFNDEPTQLIKVSSRGLIGNDRSDFIKRASHSFLPAIDNIKLAEGQVPVHLLALGATERIGPNRNGDGFSEKVCRERHDTFTKFAKFFRNHKNKPAKGDPHYGQVKLSAYNEDMGRVELLVLLNGNEKVAKENGGLVADVELHKLANGESFPVSMACVVDPYTPVLTRDSGYVPISSVEPGMWVWTHQGRWKRVKALNRRSYTGDIYSIRCNGLPYSLKLTADHPMMLRMFKQKDTKAAARRYFSSQTEFDAVPKAWAHISHARPGDRLFYMPITRYTGYAELDCEKLAAVLGYYTAEGSLNFNGNRACTVQFSCNMSDSLPRRLPALLDQIYPGITVKQRPHAVSAVGLELEVFNTELAEFIRYTMGRGCRGKYVPPEIFNARDEVKKAYLGAWLDGDGWLDAKGIHWSSASFNLLLQGRDLLATLGIPSSIYAIDHAKCATSGKENSGWEYTLNVSRLEASGLAPYSAKAADSAPAVRSLRTKPACMRLCPDQSYAYRISKVEVSHATDIQTYNFEVEDDESYSLVGFVSHNCRVPHDICSYCGNKAKTRDEYCTHEKCAAGGCKDNLGKLVKVAGDLHHLHVDNPNPTWFDISRVFRPADRIAYGARASYLSKQASDDSCNYLQYEIVKSAESVAPPEVLIYGSGQEEQWSQAELAQLKLAYALSDIEQRPAAANELLAVPTARAATSLIKVASDSRSLPSLLHSLDSRKIILSLGDYAELTGRTHLTKEAQLLLPQVYTRGIQTEALLPAIKKANALLGSALETSTGREIALRLRNDFSFEKQAVMERTAARVIRNSEKPTAATIVAAFQPSQEAEKLAMDYAAYKLHSLYRIAEFDDQFPLTATLSVRQNQLRNL